MEHVLPKIAVSPIVMVISMRCFGYESAQKRYFLLRNHAIKHYLHRKHYDMLMSVTGVFVRYIVKVLMFGRRVSERMV